MKEPIVQTKNGTLRGVVQRNVENEDYCAFKGIPYAQPPIGDLRFKDPVPTDDWPGIKEATEYGNPCIQYDGKLRLGSEDCLYLNVFVKSIENETCKKPVMVFIHGGAYVSGSGNDSLFGPEYLMRRNIVLVTFNYRLGVFGFLNLEDEIAPGNQGLKDQILVLKWIQTNIENFGGDPKNVTLFGESSGAIFVHYITLSSLAQGLFHKAICQSGVILSPWSEIKNPKRYALQLCSYLGKYTCDPKEMYEFLRTIDSQRLVQAQQKCRSSADALRAVIPFGPGMDNKSPSPVMSIPVEEAGLEAVQVPYLLGYNSREGIYYLVGLKEEQYQSIDRNFAGTLHPETINLLKTYNLFPQDMRRIYFEDERISKNNCRQIADMKGDLHLIESHHRTIKVQAEKSSSPTYLYKFSYDADLTMTKALLRYPIEGACHFDEIEFLFHCQARKKFDLEPLRKGTHGYTVMLRMTEMWTNFAAYGTPTPTTSELLPVIWEPINDSLHIRYLNIDKDLQMETTLNFEQRLLSANSKGK